MADNINTEAFKDDIKLVLEDAVDGLLEGAAEDLQGYLNQISLDMAQAMALPPEKRDPMMEEMRHQAQAIGELQRIRAVNQGWEAFQKTLFIVQRTAIAALVAAI